MATMMAGSTDTLGDVLTLNFRVHRLHLMYDYRQQSEELIDDFVNRARILADKCQFTDDELNERLIELLVYSTPYEGLRQELLTKPTGYSIEDALNEGRKYEVCPKEELEFVQDVKIQTEDQDQNQDHLLSEDHTLTAHKQSDRKPSTVKSFPCHICGKAFNRRYNFAVHQKMHARKPYVPKPAPGEKSYKCDVCGKCFKQARSLPLHIKTFHTNEKPYKCDVCGNAFSSNHARINHMKQLHSDEKKTDYICDGCGKSFTRKHTKIMHTSKCPKFIGSPIEGAPKDGRRDEQSVTKEPELVQDVRTPADDQDQNQNHLLLQDSTPAKLSTHKETAESDDESDNGDQLMDTVDWTSQDNIPTSPPGFTGAELPVESVRQTNAEIQPSPESELTLPPEVNVLNIPETISSGVIQNDEVNVAKDVKPDVSNHKNTSNGKKLPAKHQCIICAKFFRLASLLSAHKKTHLGGKPKKSHKPSSVKSYSCDTCGKSFNRRDNFVTHQKIHARKPYVPKPKPGEKRHKCDVCGKCFKQSKSVPLHIKTFHTNEKPYKCDVCGNAFSSNHAKKNHMKQLHSDDYKCDGCDKRFSHNHSKIKHMRKCLKLAIIAPEKVKVYTEHVEKKKAIECDVCGKCFDRSDNFARHMRIHTGEKPFKCEICNRSFRTESCLPRHMRTHTGEKPYKCEVCDRSFPHRRSMVIHMRLHTGENMTQCDACGKQFPNANYLKIHMRTHTGEKPYKCDKCEQCFFDSSSLSRHKGSHVGNKLYVCEICGASFKSANYLPVHMRKHTGEKPFKCDVCGKCFAQSSHLSEHKLIHTGQKPHKCATCGKCFTLHYQLKQHMVIHSEEERPFSCDVCHKRFKKESILTAHTKSHTEQRPYACDICGNAFKTKYDKNRHMAVHTDERNYKCDTCDKRFKWPQDKNAHMKTHTQFKSETPVEFVNTSFYK